MCLLSWLCYLVESTLLCSGCMCSVDVSNILLHPECSLSGVRGRIKTRGRVRACLALLSV